MARLFSDYQSEVLTLQAWRERQARINNLVDSVTPDQAARIARYGRISPNTPPGLVRSLAQAGIEPTHPVGQFAITQSDYRNMLERGKWDGGHIRTRRAIPQTTDQEGWNIRTQAVISAAEHAGIMQDGVLIEPEDPEGDSDEALAFQRVKKLFTDLRQPLPYLAQVGSHQAPVVFHPKSEDYTPADSTPHTTSDSGTIEYIDHPETPDNQSVLDRALSGDLFGGTTARLAERIGIEARPGKALPAITESLLDLTNRASNTTRSAGIPTPNIGSPRDQLRAMFIGFDAPVQEVQGQIRNVYSATHGGSPNFLESQSDLGQLLSGNYSIQDAGDGYFVDPESALARARRHTEAERGQIGGHNVTLGRWIADSVTEPDTTPYRIMSGLVDASVQVADPTAFVMGKVGKARVARHIFEPEEAAGMFSGVRKFFHGPTAERFLDNNVSLINRLASTDDPYDIAKLTNFKLEPSLVRDLASTPDTRQIRSLITDAINAGQIRRTTQLSNTLPARIQRSWDDTLRELNPDYKPRAIRLLQPMPGTTLDLNDPRQISSQLIRALHNAHAPEDDIRAVYNSVANSTSRDGLVSAVEAAQGAVGNMLRHYGIENDELVDSLTSLSRTTQSTHLSGLIDDIGSDVPTWETVLSDGTSQWVPGPHLPSEHLGRYIHLPDQRAIRRLTSRFKFLTARQSESAIGKPRLPIAMADWVTSEVLKPLWLLRLAWPLRVIGEEQIRMATAGLDSAFSGHPISWMGLVIGSKESRINKLLEVLPGIRAQSTLTASGVLFDEVDEFSRAVYNTHRAWLDKSGATPLPHKTLFDRAIPDELSNFRRAWGDELALLHKDPIANYIASNTLDDAVEWLWDGEGSKLRQSLIEAHPGNLQTKASVAKYIQSVSDRIHTMTSGDTALLDTIRTGQYGPAKNILRGPTNQLNPDFLKHLNSKLDSAPSKIKGNIWTRRNLRSEFGSQWNEFTDRMFGALMGTPTAKLSRSPTFKQYYWSHVAELLPYTDPAIQAKVLENAGKSGLNSRTMRSLTRQAARKSGALSMDELETLAKGYALDDTKALLYDISEKSQVSDILRTIVPFAEAWREVVGRWAKLTLDTGGKPVRRAQQIIQGARGEDFGEVMGAPEDKGFFYTNEFGEEVFAYPGAQWVMGHRAGIPGTPFQLPGIPVPLTGRVQGLNMFGSIFPSLGPVASVPLAFFLQDKPQYDWWRQQLLPFGGPGADETSTIFQLDQYLPSYMKTAVNWLTEGGNDDRIFNSSVMYVAAYLYSTGEYSNSIEDQQRLMEDARGRTRDIFAIRALGQFMLPASPSPTWIINDKNGNLLSTRILAEEFYDIVDKSKDYEDAVSIFLERYGTEAISAIIPHSSSVIPNVPVSKEAALWISDHPDIKSRFPLTYALFAPTGKFHYETYVKNFISEERDTLTPEQWLALRDNTLANYWYNQERSRLGANADSPNDQQAAWLRGVRENIQSAYPHWGDNTGRAERPDVDVLIRDLYRAAEDPFLSRTEAGRGLLAYLRIRDQAVAYSKEWSSSSSPNSFRTAQAFAPTRASLRAQAEDIATRYPAFRVLWDYVFDRELGEDDAQ